MALVGCQHFQKLTMSICATRCGVINIMLKIFNQVVGTHEIQHGYVMMNFVRAISVLNSKRAKCMSRLAVIFLTFLSVCVPTLATERISYVTVKNVKVGGPADRVVFYINENYENPFCNGSVSYYEVPSLVADNGSQDKILSVVLVAFTTGKKIHIDIEDGSNACSGTGAPLVRYVTIMSG